MPNPNEDFLYQLAGVRPVTVPSPTRYHVVREDGVVMHESTMKSLAELWRFCYAPETATVEPVNDSTQRGEDRALSL